MILSVARRAVVRQASDPLDMITLLGIDLSVYRTHTIFVSTCVRVHTCMQIASMIALIPD